MALVSANPVATSVVLTISVGLLELNWIRIAMTVVGINVNPAVLIARKVIIDREASSLFPFNLFICSIALIPNGVAAFPRPNKLAVKLDNIYPRAGWSFGMSGKSLTTSGLNKDVN